MVQATIIPDNNHGNTRSQVRLRIALVLVISSVLETLISVACMFNDKLGTLVKFIKCKNLWICHALPEQLESVSLANVAQLGRCPYHENAFGMHRVDSLLL